MFHDERKREGRPGPRTFVWIQAVGPPCRLSRSLATRSITIGSALGGFQTLRNSARQGEGSENGRDANAARRKKHSTTLPPNLEESP